MNPIGVLFPMAPCAPYRVTVNTLTLDQQLGLLKCVEAFAVQHSSRNFPQVESGGRMLNDSS